MNSISFDCMGKIAIHLPIEDLNALQRSCRGWWLGLKSKKLSYVWQGKYMEYYQRTWNKRKSPKINFVKDDIVNCLFNSAVDLVALKQENQKKAYIAMLERNLNTLSRNFDSSQVLSNLEQAELNVRLIRARLELETANKPDFVYRDSRY